LVESQILGLQISDVRCEAQDVLAIDLRNVADLPLPPWSAGAHIALHLPNGLTRQYSLCGDPEDRARYRIGVALARDSRGGSTYLHKHARVGMLVGATGPANLFPLTRGAGPKVLIAGGIGVTPLLAMARECAASGEDWRIVYCCRSRRRAAFVEELAAFGAAHCSLHFDEEAGGAPLDVEKLVAGLPPSGHIYCCGPDSLMRAVLHAAQGRPEGHVHFEWFEPPRAERAPEKSFHVVVRSSGQRYEVAPGRTILDVLEDAGELAPAACREGLCATCRVRVIDGVPEHRYFVLTQPERDANDQIMICVSRALSDVLVLDI
jgi:tetrachlorobenzoquinone reductase